MASQEQRYPIGIQTFSKLREGGYMYVDKTDLVYKIARGNSNYVFLSRPPRFGKSLLVSTLKSYFEGRKELFEGLAIEKMETEWTKHPVLHFNMNTAKHVDKEDIESELNRKLCGYEKLYGRSEDDVDPNQRLQGLVEHAYEQTGQKVVVLVDAYDAPFLDPEYEDDLRERLWTMHNFYTSLKDLAPYLRFVFLTGITRFSPPSIFGGLNNIDNISMDKDCGTICGITEEEMLTQFRPGIERLAKEEEMSYEEAVERLRQTYGGYRFCWPSPDIYDPLSLLTAMSNAKIDHYWLGSLMPSYLIRMLRKYGVSADRIGGQFARSSVFDAPMGTVGGAESPLYQNGYITIKGYEREFEEYLLDIPNKEVRAGLMNILLPEYVTPGKAYEGHSVAMRLYMLIKKGKIEEALELLKTFLSTVPYTENTDYEGHYVAMLYVILTIIGYYNVDIEVRTSTGRVDMVLKTYDTVYIFELKFNKSAQEALEQIDLKNYPERFALYGLPVVKVGLNFSSETRTIDGWAIEHPKE